MMMHGIANFKFISLNFAFDRFSRNRNCTFMDISCLEFVPNRMKNVQKRIKFYIHP